MLAILKKELNLFFATPIGYLVIAVFLLINGMFLWIFNGDFNILNAGFADLESFFFITPWFFVFMIPAITMRTFSDEIRLGTVEVIKTKPISNWAIIIGKFTGSLILILVALLPTLSYVLTIVNLAATPENIDYGSIIGSYFGLIFLAAGFTAIGLFTSTLSNNQIVAFIAGVVLSFFMYYGFEGIADLELFADYEVRNLGMHRRFESIGKGVLDTRDLIYFISVTFFFLMLTKVKFEQK